MTSDLVIITDTHHLRIMPREDDVLFIALRHDRPEPDAERAFPDAAAARAHAAAAHGVDDGDWAEIDLKPWTLVRITDDDPDAEIRGRAGHVVGLATPGGVAVMIHGLERVWCVHPDHLVETGGTLPEAERPDPRVRIRVSRDGEVL